MHEVGMQFLIWIEGYVPEIREGRNHKISVILILLQDGKGSRHLGPAGEMLFDAPNY